MIKANEITPDTMKGIAMKVVAEHLRGMSAYDFRDEIQEQVAEAYPDISERVQEAIAEDVEESFDETIEQITDRIDPQ